MAGAGAWDPDGELPIKLGPCSNGEFAPLPLGPVEREAQRRTREAAERHARRLGVPRREFLRGLGGAALMLGVLAACHDESNRSQGKRSGGTYRVPKEAADEPEAAAGALAGEEFVFDVQTHYLNYDLAQEGGITGLAGLAQSFPQSRCGDDDPRACFSVEHYLDLLFAQSDTSLVVLTAIPIAAPANPLELDDMELARRLAERLCGDGRVLLHGGVQPTVGPRGAQIEGMADLVAQHPIKAWKVYTHAPGQGWWLDDHDAGAPQVGHDFLARVRETGPRMVCVHKGFSGGSAYASPVDVGPAAAANPDIDFVVYHSGFESDHREGPYRGDDPAGVDRLIASLAAAGIRPGGNVYAELGSTWWVAMRDPTQAAHTLGKLLQAVGPDNVLWGTDSLWYGSPQDQIQAFRAFEIAPELQEQHGYPALTPEVKRKVLGGNALRLYAVEAPTTRCEFTREELARVRATTPAAWRTHGPSTTRELRTLLAAHGAL
jgi:hypothetical protein